MMHRVAAQRIVWKVVLGVILIVLVPIKGGFLGFISPNTPYGMGRDFAMLLTYAIGFWLLYAGLKPKR